MLLLMRDIFFYFKFYFLLGNVTRAEGRYERDGEMNGIGKHAVKSTKNQSINNNNNQEIKINH